MEGHKRGLKSAFFNIYYEKVSDMYILGVHCGHDASASLLCDDDLIACAEEERFNRIKHAMMDFHFAFPFESIKFCLNYAGIKGSDIDYVGFTFKPYEYVNNFIPKNLPDFLDYLKFLYITFPTKSFCVEAIRSMGITTKKIHFLEHHLCHASSAFRASGFKKSMIITWDSRGEKTATATWVGNRDAIEKIDKINVPHSIGRFYSNLTQYLGFKPLSDEWKVMGLSSYGEPKINLPFVKMEEKGKYIMSIKYMHRYGKAPIKNFVKCFNQPARESDSEITIFHKNLAASLQATTEKLGLHILKNLSEVTGLKKLCLAGGVAFNCKMNGFLLHSGIIKDMFIQPAAGDAGTSLGAVFEICSNLGYHSKFKMKHVYYGAKYSKEKIEELLKNSKINYEYCDDIESIVAEKISQQKIIGWFQDRFEFGPRALGNRSILADPRKKEMKDKVNNCVKYREWWRPFAPTILSSKSRNYLDDFYPSPFMILSFNVKEEKRDEIPAVVHVDGTTRPQTLEKEVNPKYFKLIKKFEDLTGVPVLLNTSFNLRGDPIVNAPKEAIETFFTSGMDILVINNFLIKKTK